MTSARGSAAAPLRIHEVDDASSTTAIRVLRTISAASFAGRPVPARRWLVKDLIPEGKVTMLSGDGGVGKSLLALQLAAAVATATEWIGRMPEPGGVLYLSAEDEEDEAHRRLSDIAAAHGSFTLRDLGDLHLAPIVGEDAFLAAPEGRSGVLSTTPLWLGLEERLSTVRPSLLVLDNLADVFGGDELSRSQARKFISMLQGAAIRHRTTVLLLAHPSLSGMASGSGLSGSTAWNGSVRSRLYLDRPPKVDEADPDLRVLRTVKANHAPTGAETKLRWAEGVFRAEGLGASGYSRAAAEAHAETCFLELLARLDRDGRNVSDKPGTSYAPATFNKEDASITSKAFERAMRSLFAAGSIRVDKFGPPSRLRTRIVKT